MPEEIVSATTRRAVLDAVWRKFQATSSSPEKQRAALAGHLDALIAALAMQDPRLLAGHAKWAARVSHGRKDGARWSPEVIEALADELGSRTDAALATQAKRLITEAAALPGHVDASALSMRPIVKDLLDALLRGDRAQAHALLLEASGTRSISRLAADVVRPAMAELGRRWEEGAIRTGDEHMATALLQSLLAGVPHARPETASRGSALFACVPGNHHSLGLWLAAAGYEEEGWRVRYLGADVPADEIVREAQTGPFDLVGLSVSLPLHVVAAQRIIADIRAAMGPRAPRIIVGGLPIEELGGLAARIGAEPAASAQA